MQSNYASIKQKLASAIKLSNAAANELNSFKAQHEKLN